MPLSYEQFFEDWLVESFWQMIDDLDVHYTLWPEVEQMFSDHPDVFGDNAQEKLESLLLQRLYVNHEDSWWEGIHIAQNEAFWERAKNNFFTAALYTLNEVIAEPIRLNQETFQFIQRHMTHRLPIETRSNDLRTLHAKALKSRLTAYQEHLHIMAYMWTQYFFIHLAVLFPAAFEAKLFGPYHRRAHFRLLPPKKKSQPKE
ncbi:MAG: hypothetical protein IMX04_04475 [Candidatus Carbobacillus altaicus]|uniref:Uncharacterized protein n=1 Tax=Candidatus Carbonibacillus altaicus TaxID=2163959 RepID=A0A2R6Y5F5_9BACL|nr:hypothetical protein [Candidatus Carbobacillus altaicus]PTQ57902.1 MAG: hypothetical protein BSOLF_0413 [Candidatus Carbobacillus altaicus]